MPDTRGVYFQHNDYAAFPRRVMVELIDVATFTFLLALPCFILVYWMLGGEPDANVSIFLFPLLFGIAVFYFVILKRSGFRTLGYKIGRVKIVGLDGRRPGYWPLFVRMAFGLVGPIYWPVDLAWSSSDPHRQALRDKFANTYVVKLSASPAGEGEIVTRHYFVCGLSFPCREVEMADSLPSSEVSAFQQSHRADWVG